ncbi:hypothetical protein P691DRAFT_785787 [Macrolepiota fuliginosa MF-IS2]|uniref:Galactose oxidase n=1 Tax=Macrolepiota fuliginosa MF-IS2 TaxID=1400762 RepID=A0A9P5XJK6_9AGAR|nr:hypothetical protein P691DRAFT_785787 [Macrolepiota fuliginosa MF-IS2]
MNLRHMERGGRNLPNLLLVLSLFSELSVAYSPEPRWGQAAVVVNDALFVHGGKTDRFNSYSYTSAPNTNDLLYLSLSKPFDTASPPWELVGSSTNSSTPQGPAISWHTLSAFNGSGALLFGGQPGPNSLTVIVDGADSAILLDVADQSQPVWHPQAASWAGQPIRRIYHSSATSLSGIVYIIGGQTADDSGHAFSEHYAFDPRALTFSQLPAENGPPALYGHASLMLTDGRLLVLGGITQGSPIPFSTIWVLDTTKDALIWVPLQVDTSSLPAPRRAFAAAVIAEGKILIHGGSDESLQTNFDDGWILDTSREPAVWTRIDQLTQIGPRRDHCAISSNEQVIFSFGYSNSGPAPAAMQIFDLSTNSYIPSYAPPSPTTAPTQTIPGQTGTPTGTVTHPNSGASSGSTHTTQTATPGGNAGGGNGEKKPVAAIAAGTTLGVLGAIAIGAAVIIYSRRHQRARDRSFLVIDGDDDDGHGSLHAGPIIPAAAMYDEKGAPSTGRWGNGLLGSAFGIAGTITAVAKLRNTRGAYQRRDMLADEDTRDFGEWYNTRRRDGTGGSSWSLRSILGARFRSREPSTFSLGSASHRPERTDPFSDGTSLIMYDEDPATPGVDAAGPSNRRETSYASTGGYSYVDPFADPIQEEKRSGSQRDLGRYRDEEYEPTSAATILSRPPVSLPTIRMVPPVSTGGHPLSPLSEHTSKTSLSNDYTASSSHVLESPLETSASHSTAQTTMEPTSSRSSHKPPIGSPRSPGLLSSTIIPASVPLPNVRRSNSWWSKFYRTSFLDRKSSSASRGSALFEIRDPNPPPVLNPIREGTSSVAADDSSSKSDHHVSNSEQLSRTRSKVYAADPGKSLTSLRTADTEQIERMAGTMDVVQRVRTRSQRTSGSISSSGLSIDTGQIGGEGNGDDGLPVSSAAQVIAEEGSSTTPRPHSPAPPIPILPPPSRHKSMSTRELLPSSSQIPLVTTPTIERPPTGPTSPSSVAARIQMYERRLSQDQEQLPPTNTRHWEEKSPKKSRVSVNYGFVPRPNLFIANPDHRISRSGDS